MKYCIIDCLFICSMLLWNQLLTAHVFGIHPENKYFAKICLNTCFSSCLNSPNKKRSVTYSNPPKNIVKIKLKKIDKTELIFSQCNTPPIINEAKATFIKDLNGNFQMKNRRESIIIRNKRKA